MAIDTNAVGRLLGEKVARLAHEPARIKGLTARYLFDIGGDGGGQWTMDIVDGKATLSTGDIGEPDIVIRSLAPDFTAVVSGLMTGQEAYMAGKLTSEGNIMLAMRLQSIFGDTPPA